jgi:hypothetical protein
MEQLEKDGGGTLILKKGSYVITNTLYIPSNVTLILEDGVTISKGSITGTSKLLPSKSLFQLVPPSKAQTTKQLTKYNSSKNVTFKTDGKAIIDLNYEKDATAIILGHNEDITISGITFQKMYEGNFIKIGASQDVTIKKNIFRYHKDSENNAKEAIALETPDEKTKAFVYPWSKSDKTANSNIIIEENEFFQLERAIGSSKYTEKVYHKNISILHNKISKTDSHALRMINWEYAKIKNNRFSDISNKDGSLKAILISGGKYPTISNNEFSNSDRPIQIMPWKNNNNGSSYRTTYNTINEANKADMLRNTLVNMKEYYIRYNKTYNEFTKDTEKWEFIDLTATQFIITPSSEPYQNYFTNYSTYNNNTKQYYMIRSYLEQLERVGGGTLSFQSGTYVITNTLYISSNINIVLEDGVVIRKGNDTSSAQMEDSKSIFQLAAPTKSKTAGAYGGYKGETNIHFQGNGKAIIDLNYIQDAIGIVMGHNTNVTISGIIFQNMYSGHFIELDASKDVTIEKNIFQNHKASASEIKEAINIDTPDKNTGGFNAVWTNYDCTPNKDILIRNNVFDHLERAIGTHKYSEGKYHENVQILNNKISNTSSDAIRIINWKNPVIKENEIIMVAEGKGNDRAILASGVINPIITDNFFMDVTRPIQLMPWKNNGTGSSYAITYNSVTYDNILLMLKNYLRRVEERFIRVNNTYNVFDRNTDRYYYSNQYTDY